MIRKIIVIDEAKCNGCGLCASACHEGAIGMVEGKAKLLREDYCDGLGDCLPACPTGAITFEQREAPAYNESAVMAAKMAGKSDAVRLQNFPIQLKLVPVSAPWYDGADLLIAADCTAFACGDFREFLKGKVTLIGCPKLDGVDYSEKLEQLFRSNAIRSVHVVRMQVPCCGGLPYAVKTALERCGSDIPMHVVTVSADGRIVQ